MCFLLLIADTALRHPALEHLSASCIDGKAHAPFVKQLFPNGTYEPAFEWLDRDRERFDEIAEHLDALYKSQDAGPAPRASFDKFEWAVCIMRTFSFQNAQVAWGEFGKTILIPLGEYFPHNHDLQNTEYEYDPVHKQWHFRAARPIEAGAPLYISFGCRSKIEYLQMVSSF